MPKEELLLLLNIISECLINAPVDFLGTSDNGEEAKKEENEWRAKWENAIGKSKRIIELSL